MSTSKEIAARATAAKWGGRTTAEAQRERYAAGDRIAVVEVVDGLTAVADRLEAALDREF